MADENMKKRHYDSLPNWMNPEKWRKIEEEFYGVRRREKEDFVNEAGERKKAEA